MVKTQMKIVSSIQDKFTFHPKQQSAFKLNIFISMFSWIRTYDLNVVSGMFYQKYFNMWNILILNSVSVYRFYKDIFKAIM